MNFNQLAWTRAAASLLPSEGVMCVALYLAMRADHATGVVPAWVTREVVAKDTARAERTVASAMKWLAHFGFCDRRGPEGGPLQLHMTDAAKAALHALSEVEQSRSDGADTRAAAARPTRAVAAPVQQLHTCSNCTPTRATAALGDVQQLHTKSQDLSESLSRPAAARPPALAHTHEGADQPTPDAAPGHDPAFAATVADRALDDAAVQRAAVAVRAAYESGVEAGHPGCAGDGTLDDAAAMVRWALEHLGEHPALLPGMSLADVERLLCDVARDYGAWRAKPDGKASGGTRYLRPKPLRYLGSPGRDGLWNDLRAQLDRAVAQRQAVVEKAEAGKASATAQTVRERVEATRRATEAKAKADARAWAERNGVAVADDGGDELVPEAQTRRLVKALTGEVG